MAQTFRYPEILSIARRDGKVTVDGLAEHFGVTQQTIRRDLSELADAGKLDRVHGGAIIPSGTENIAYLERRSLNLSGKVDIARAAAARLPEHCSVFLNIGTTTEAVANELLSHRDLMAVTNNMNVANILSQNQNCEVHLTGGTLRRTDGGLIGAITMDTIRKFKFDYAVIGCSALDLEGDILDFDIAEVGVSQAIIAQARKVFLVADHTKFQRNAPARIGSLSQIDCLFTDKPLVPALQSACDRWNTTVVVADPR